MKILTKYMITAAILIALSMSAFAAVQYLSAKEVAEKTGHEDIAPLFENSQFEEQTITDGKYSVTLHGIVSADKIQEIDGAQVEDSRSYIVVSVVCNDGSLPDVTEGMPLQFSPLVGGYEVHKVNLWSLEAGGTGLQHNGVQYYLFDTRNIEIFADHTVYIAAYEGFIPSKDIFTMKDDGTIAYNEKYEGFRAMFTLKLDESKADPEKVKALLENF